MNHKQLCTGEKFQIITSPSLGHQICYFKNGISDMTVFKKKFYKDFDPAIDAILKKFPKTKLSQIAFGWN